VTTRSLSRLARQLVADLLDDAELIHDIQSLPPDSLLSLIRHLGLEDAAEIAEIATVSQLEALFDEELWQSAAPGADERFDDDRFALWLSILLEGGERSVAAKLAELPQDLVTLGLERRLLVVDLDELAVELSDAGEDAELTEKALDGALCHEFDQYRVIARRHEGWDSVLGVLLALDTHDRATLERLLERSSAISRDYIADNGGLYEVLTSEEMLEADVAGAREDRRAAAGFVAPSSARSFLALAEITPLSELVASRERDPVTRAYFRELRPERPGRPEPPRSASLRSLLREAGAEPRAARRLLGDRELLFVQAMQELAAADPALYAARLEELAYLTNVLLAAAPDGVRLRPVEAAERAVAIVDAGLRYLLAEREDRLSSSRARELLSTAPLDQLFLVAWHRERKSAASARSKPRATSR
jgi:hypothetical protein